MSYFNQVGSFNSLLKEGFKHYKGAQEAIMRNIEAVNDMASMTRTSLGPNGMNKYIINMHDKLFLTKDTSVMAKELEVNHPAVNILIEASKSQDQEAGDGTNFVITFGGELLNLAGELINSGVHLSDITLGYEKGFNKALEVIDKAPQYKIDDISKIEEATKIIKPVIGSKMVHGQEGFLAPIVAQACINVLPNDRTKFNVDNVRVSKILGGTLMKTETMKGLVIVRNVEGSVTKCEKCNVAVYNCPLETQGAETSDQIVFKTADELLNYTKSEEENMEKIIKNIVDSGVKCVIVGGAISNMAIHYLDKYGILAFRVMSKFELRRIASACGASLLVRLGPPTKEEMGYADEIKVTEISSEKCIVLTRDSENNKLSTIILRGTTNDMLDNMERVIADGVNAYRDACKNNVYVAGAGAIEMHLSNEIKSFGKTITTLDQYGIEKFGEAFEVVPRTLLENSGYNVNEVLATLRSKNNSDANMGINIKNGEIEDTMKLGILDHLETKKWAIKHAVNSVLTILKVDQVIVAKPAGGPTFKKPPGEEALQKDEY
jgi:T-complex protein 1 subunit theta